MMNKYSIGIIALIVIVLGVGLVVSLSGVSYVSNVSEEVSKVETELAEVEVLMEDRLLTSERAEEIQARIVARLEAINETVASASKETLSLEQKAALDASLERLRRTIVTYSSSLDALEDLAGDAIQGELTIRGRTVPRTIANMIADTVETVEMHIEEPVEGSGGAASEDDAAGEPLEGIGADDREVSGNVVNVDAEMVAVDGPYVVTIDAGADGEVTVHIPSMGILLCAANEDIAPVGDITAGANVSVRGSVGEDGAVTPCDSDEHYFRVN